MDHITMETGKKTSKKDLDKRSGLMNRSTQGSTVREWNMGMESFNSRMEVVIKENGNMILEKVKDKNAILLEGHILENGRMEWNMGLVHILFQMGRYRGSNG